MTTLFQSASAFSDGAGRIFIDKNGDVKMAGHGVQGREDVSMDSLAKMFGAKSVKDNMNESKFNADRFEDKNPNDFGKISDFKRGDGDDVAVKFGGAGVAGNFRAVFDNDEDAAAFQQFLADNPAIFMYAMGGDASALLADSFSTEELIDMADATGGETTITDAINDHSIRLQDEGTAVKIGGLGVGGNKLFDFEDNGRGEAYANALLTNLQQDAEALGADDVLVV